MQLNGNITNVRIPELFIVVLVLAHYLENLGHNDLFNVFLCYKIHSSNLYDVQCIGFILLYQNLRIIQYFQFSAISC